MVRAPPNEKYESNPQYMYKDLSQGLNDGATCT